MSIENSIVLIAGGAGLVGSATAKKLASKGARVIVADLKPTYTVGTGIEYCQLDILQKGSLPSLIEEYQPNYVINAINIATIFSRHPHQGYEEIIGFYVDFYRSLRAFGGALHYIQIGTTGSGGLGFNIPFTHGDKLEDLPIINKAAFSGITTAMLTLLSRSFEGKMQVSELKPGLAIFADDIFDPSTRGARLVTLDGGESGHYTYAETALLTQSMGFTTVSRIVEAVLAILEGEKREKMLNEFDIIENINQTIIAPNERDAMHKQEVLQEMKKRQGKEYVIATGNLGPPFVTRDLILGHMLSAGLECKESAQFARCMEEDPSVWATLEYIKNVNQNLYHYLRAECTHHNYELLRHYYREGAEAWQVAGASLSKAAIVG